jgi:hypothetical protein
MVTTAQKGNSVDFLCAFNQNSSVSIMIRQRAQKPGNLGSIPGRAKKKFIFYSFQIGSGEHRASYPMGNEDSFPQNKADGEQTYLYLVSRLINHGGIPPLSSHIFMV